MTVTRVEFSRPIVVGELPEPGREFAIEANSDERKALAARFGIVGIDSLCAEGTIKQSNGGREIRIEGMITADVQQVCVVSLDVFSTHIKSLLRGHYSADASDDWMTAHKDHDVMVVDSTQGDWIEPINNGIIDIGEAVAQELSLNLAPYPRKSGEPNTQNGSAENNLQEDNRQSPFAGLRELPLMRDKRQH